MTATTTLSAARAATIVRADYANADHAAESGARPEGNAQCLFAVSLCRWRRANCFWAFSTFAAKPLVNIHDVVVDEKFRGKGIGRQLFAEIETVAREKDACKITLEVLSGNAPAKALYASLGYGDYALDPDKGHTLFWQKRLET